MTSLMVSCMSVINISGDKTPKLDRVSEYWPRTIQHYWSDQENRQKSLQAKLLSETIRLQTASRPRKQLFASGRVLSLRATPFGRKAVSATGCKIDFCCFEGFFTGGTILLVDVSLTAIQAGFKKRDLFDPVVSVVGFNAHG